MSTSALSQSLSFPKKQLTFSKAQMNKTGSKASDGGRRCADPPSGTLRGITNSVNLTMVE